MDNSDVALRVRYAASLDDSEAVRVIALGGQMLDVSTVASWRKPKDDEVKNDVQVECSQVVLEALLAGLIIERRGPPPKSKDASVNEKVVSRASTSASSEKHDSAASAENKAKMRDNNHVLKQLRIAFKLRTDDVHELIVRGGGRLSKSETGALFRNASARNYRRCGDQILRWFLRGLGEQERGQS